MKPNVIFMGTPDFAVSVLEKLCEISNVILVVTQPDKIVGRKKELRFSPVKEFALSKNIEVFQPELIKNEIDYMSKYEADLIVTCAYGQFLPKALLDLPKIASINVHASLLPNLRGGAPIHHAIIDGYEKTGITIMYMDSKMDAGDIISQEETIITPDDNLESLHDRLKNIAPILLERTLPSIINGTNSRVKQDESKVTFGLNIKREEEQINFSNNGKNIINLIRGLNPMPLANAIINDQECKIVEARFNKKENTTPYKVNISKNSLIIECADGEIEIIKLKPFGKKIMDVKDYINGLKNTNMDIKVSGKAKYEG